MDVISFMRHGTFAVLVLLFVWNSPVFAEAEIIAFGLRHSVISNAIVTGDSESPIYVARTAPPCDDTNVPPACPELTFGASVHLGAADAGVFLWPSCDRGDGWSLEGTSYGTVNGVANTRIGSVTGTRFQWANYNIHLDFTPSGVTSYTYQVFFHDLPTLLVTNGGPDSATVYTGNYTTTPPRVNPLWRDGNRIGVLVDFDSYPTEFRLPGYRALATRLVITAERPTNNVELVSRLDVLGRNGLPSFTIGNERLGKFGVFHEAIGNTRFHATPSRLSVSNGLPTSNGYFTELNALKKYEVLLVPYAFTNPGFSCVFSASGTHARVADIDHLRDVSLIARTNGSISLTVTGIDVQARVYSNGLFLGTITGSQGDLGSITDTNALLLSYGAAATQTNEPAYFLFRFAAPITLAQTNGASFTGDELHVSLTDSNDAVGTLASFATQGQNIGELVITGVVAMAAPPEPLEMQITSKADVVRVSWTANPDFQLISASEIAPQFWQFWPPAPYTNFHYYMEFPITNHPTHFFRLRHTWDYGLLTPE